MRLPGLLVVLLASAAVAPAQTPQVWPLAKISFPVDLAAFNQLSPKPVAIRFYAAPPGKEFKLVSTRKPTDLDEILNTRDPAAAPRRGFNYDSPADGDMEFAVQYEYADGALNPPTAKLPAQYRIRFDTRPPAVKAVASGSSGIKWQVEDENLLTRSIRVEGRFVGAERWEFLNTGELKAEDSFKWDIPPGKTLEVRVYARDKAGHENRSTPIKLSGADVPADKPRDGSAPPPPTTLPDTPKGPGKTGTGYGGLDDLPANRPKIDYISTNKLRLTNKITHITRSGVKAVQLFVQEPTNGADWLPAGKKTDLTITPDTPDAERWVSIDYEAPRDGLYGFIFQPISGAGTKNDDPRAGDNPQLLVEVDTTIPEMAIKNVKVAGGGLNGPLIEIEWEAKDKNLTATPIDLEYSEDLKAWKSVAAKAANTGRHTWEITDKKLWRFYVRGSASDMAGNTKLTTYGNDKGEPVPVLVDLDKPSGSVDKVTPNGDKTIPPGGGRSGIGFETPPGGGTTGMATPGPLTVTPAKIDTPATVPSIGGSVPTAPATPPAEEKKPAAIPTSLPTVPPTNPTPAPAPTPTPSPPPGGGLPIPPIPAEKK